MAKDIEIRVGRRLDEAGGLYAIHLNKSPHLLVAGTTGSGKSVFLNSIILQLIASNTPDEVELFLGDPKRVELSIFSRAPHCKIVARTLEEHDLMIEQLNRIMDKRYAEMERFGIRNIMASNVIYPNIVCVLDEFADVVLNRTLNGKVSRRIIYGIVRLARMGRAAAITLLIGTQYPVAKVVDTSIKANFPTRVCFKVATQVESRVVIDRAGGERLRGNGHMFFMNPREVGLIELQGLYFSDKQIQRVINKINGRWSDLINV